MDIEKIILLMSAFFLASFLKGLTGLGFATLCLGLLSVFMDIKLAIPLVFLPSLSSNIFVMVESGRFTEALKRFWPLYLTAVPGLILGITILSRSDNQIPKAILGIVMLIYGMWGLKEGTGDISEKSEKILMVPVGFFSGFVNGLTGSQIMPVMPYLLSLKMDRDLFVQTINSSFTFSTIIMIAGFGTLGFLSKPVILFSAAGIIPVAIGIYAGGKIRKKVTEENYRKMVLILLIVLGLNLVIKPFT